MYDANSNVIVRAFVDSDLQLNGEIRCVQKSMQFRCLDIT